MAVNEGDIDSAVIIVSGPDEQVIVRKDDLLHCLQVAVWRAGLLEQRSLLRLKEALGIGEDESVPKPDVR